jgi:hypothetical protein
MIKWSGGLLPRVISRVLVVGLADSPCGLMGDHYLEDLMR